MNSLTFVNGLNRLKRDNINIHSLLAIRNNKIVLDACFYPFQRKYVHDLASVTKSITSLLIGIAIDKGYIKNENQSVLYYFPEYAVKNDTLKTLRIKDLLNMASGLPLALKGFWENNKLVIYYNELCKINLYKFIFTFSENNVDFDYQDQTNDLHLNLKGSIKK